MFAWRPPDPPSYSYLLGLYLGDGWVLPKPRGGAQLIIVCATEYPQLIEDCWAAMILVSMNPHVTRYQPRGQACIRLMSAWKHWLDVIPQHGPGRKHNRKIELVPWQREIVDRHPREFLRGLLHSDGCRTINRFTTRLPSGRLAEYAYIRAGSSRTRRTTFAGCSASTASSSGFAGRSPTRATSRSPIARASRYSTRSCR